MFSSTRAQGLRHLPYSKLRWRSWQYMLLALAIVIFVLHTFWGGTQGSRGSLSGSNGYGSIYRQNGYFGGQADLLTNSFEVALSNKPSRPPRSGAVLIDSDVDLSSKPENEELDDLLLAVDAATTSFTGLPFNIHVTKNTSPPPRAAATTTTTTSPSSHTDIQKTPVNNKKNWSPQQNNNNNNAKNIAAPITTSPSTQQQKQKHSTPAGKSQPLNTKSNQPSQNTDPTPIEQKYPTCKIYVVDPDIELAANLGLPRCNITEVWPFDKPGLGVEGLEKTPHWSSQYASGYWISKSIKNSFASTDDIRTADIVYVNTHCYSSWYSATQLQFQQQQQQSQQLDSGTDPLVFNPINDAALASSRLFIEGVTLMKQFTQTAGRRYSISRPVLGSPPGAMMDTCAKLKRSFLLVSERGIFCDNDRDRAAHGDSLIIPYVVVAHVNMSRPTTAVQRPVFLSYRGRCGNVAGSVESTPAGVFIDAMVNELGGDLAGDKNDGADIDIDCDLAEKTTSQKQTAALMQRSVFCIVMPSPDHQATRALPAAVLSGCIPVFFGAPFHALPLAGDVDYGSMAVFFNITESGRYDRQSDQDAEQPPTPGELEPNAMLFERGAVISVPTFTAALEYLRGLKMAKISSMQMAVERERPKLYYPPLPGARESALGRIVVGRMCDYAQRLNEMLAARDEARALNPNDTNSLPKLAVDMNFVEDNAEDSGNDGGNALAGITGR